MVPDHGELRKVFEIHQEEIFLLPRTAGITKRSIQTVIAEPSFAEQWAFRHGIRADAFSAQRRPSGGG